MNEIKGYCDNCGKYQPMTDVEEHAPPPTPWVCPSVYYGGKCEVCGRTATLYDTHLGYSSQCMGTFLIFKFDSYADFLWKQLPWYRRLAYFIARFFLGIAIRR